MKLRFAVDYTHKGERVELGHELEVDDQAARPLIHEGIARKVEDAPRPATRTQAKPVETKEG